jgi:putative endonuclease
VRIIARNFRWRGGELDLIGVADDLLLFVEVRQRTRADFGGGLASVDFRKRRKLRRAAEVFRLRRPEWRAHRARFDVLALEGDVLALEGDVLALEAGSGALDGTAVGAAHLVWVKDAFI